MCMSDENKEYEKYTLALWEARKYVIFFVAPPQGSYHHLFVVASRI